METGAKDKLQIRRYAKPKSILSARRELDDNEVDKQGSVS